MATKESTGYHWILLKCMTAILGLSVCLSLRSELSDQLYGVLVLVLAGTLLFRLPKKKFSIFDSQKFVIPMIVFNRGLVILFVLCSFILTQSYTEFAIILLVITLLNFLFMSDLEIQASIKKLGSKVGFLSSALLLLSFIAFIFDIIKTPGSMQDTHHPVYLADEIQAPSAGLHNWRTYTSQYTALLGYIAIPFLNKQSPLDLQVSTYSFLIFIQYIAVAILFVLILGIVGFKNFKWPFIFAFAVLSGPFFFGYSVLDWLQNFPSRTLFPLVTIYFYFLFLRTKQRANSPNLSLRIRIKTLNVLIGVFAAVGLLNDLMFGAPIVIAVVLSILFSHLAPSTKIRFLILFAVTFTWTSVLINNYVLRAPESLFSFDLVTHYMFSYGNDGFAHLFDVLGIEIFFWGFGLSGLVIARYKLRESLDSYHREVLYPILILSSCLVFSTIPYTTGRSFTAQIWASSAIYVILVFACMYRLFLDSEVEISIQSGKLSNSMILAFVALLFSFCSGSLNPIQVKNEINRIVSKDEFVPTSSELETQLDSIRGIVQEIKLPLRSISLLTSYGNNMSINLGIRNGLIVNHPTSIIFKKQMDTVCERNYSLGAKVLIADSYLKPFLLNSKTCSKYFGDLQVVNDRIFLAKF